MENKHKQQKKPKIVSKPFLRGSAIDSHLGMDSLRFFGTLIIMAVIYLLLSTVLMFDSLLLRVTINLAVALAAHLLFYTSGVTKGTSAVNLGEMLYLRKDSGHAVPEKELQACYHPLKGFMQALVGSLPLFVCAVLLAITAQVQTTGLSALPSWLSGYESRAEIGNALLYYHEVVPMGVEGVTRLIVRICLMPFVTLIGSDNPQGLLLLEHLSPLVVLLPALFYGVGYTQGVAMRAKVHTSIATNDHKRAKKEKKRREAKLKTHTPEQLN